jgi:hypothetical protein
MLRLPQSMARSLSTGVSSSFRVASVVLVAAFVTLFSLSAQAVSEPLTCTPTSLNFGRVLVDHPETQLAVLTNSGHRAVTVSAMNLIGSEFSVSGLTLPVRLAAGASVTFNVRFAPTAKGWAGGRVTFASSGTNSTLQLSLAGAGVASEVVKASPASVTFGQVAVGSSSTLPLVLTNDRPFRIELLALYPSSQGSAFSITGPRLPLVLKAGQSAKFVVKFAPRTTGLVGESVLVEGPGIEIPIEGTGTQTSAGQLQIAPDPLNFGKVPVGTPDTQLISLSATGASVTVTSASSSNSQFVLEGASFPFTITPGRNVSLQVAFTPKSSGTISATLTFVSNASNSPTQESVSGIGTTPPPLYVTLSWNPSTSAVAGYNVYRGPGASGPWGKLNTALDANTAYHDNTVVSGNTYYYAATAVDSSGKESALSTPVEAVVP